jgi:hypothetical protein
MYNPAPPPDHPDTLPECQDPSGQSGSTVGPSGLVATTPSGPSLRRFDRSVFQPFRFLGNEFSRLESILHGPLCRRNATPFRHDPVVGDHPGGPTCAVTSSFKTRSMWCLCKLPVSAKYMPIATQAFIRSDAMDVTKPYEFKLGDPHGPKNE